jgi:hypothetical protein
MEMYCEVAEFFFSLDKTISIVKDVILAGAAASGAIVAWKGLNTWNRQHQGQHAFNLVRSILIALYQYRDAIHYVRNPMIWAHEMALTDEERQGANEDKVRYLESEKAYLARWKHIDDARTSLTASLSEAEALWGSDSRTCFDPVFKSEQKLSSAINTYLRLQRSPNLPVALRGGEQQMAEREKIMNRPFDEEKDEFGDEFKESIALIEKHLRAKLPKSH